MKDQGIEILNKLYILTSSNDMIWVKDEYNTFVSDNFILLIESYPLQYHPTEYAIKLRHKTEQFALISPALESQYLWDNLPEDNTLFKLYDIVRRKIHNTEYRKNQDNLAPMYDRLLSEIDVQYKTALSL